jgi:hypothetical protein
MYPHERSLVEKYSDHFVIIGVNSDRGKEKLLKAMKRENISWTSFYDGGGTGGPIALQWGVRGWPTTYLIDTKGVIRFKSVRGDSLDDALGQLLIEIGVKPAEIPKTAEL